MSEGSSDGGEGESSHAEGGEEHISDVESHESNDGYKSNESGHVEHGSARDSHRHSSHSGKDGKSKGHKPNPKAHAKGNENTNSRENTRTLNGAVALIVYEDPETGKIEFYFEEKPQNYYIRKYRGKLSLIGGAIDTTDKDSLEALVREFGEEVETWKARDILQNKARANRKVYQKIIEYVNGKPAITYVYSIRITSREEWNAIKKSGLRDDAGPSRILTLEEILKLGHDDFAFNQWEVIYGFIHENYISKPKKSAQNYVIAPPYSVNTHEAHSGSEWHNPSNINSNPAHHYTIPNAAHYSPIISNSYATYSKLEEIVNPLYLRQKKPIGFPANNFYDYKMAA